MMILLFIFSFVVTIYSAPVSPNEQPAKLAFSLAQPENYHIKPEAPSVSKFFKDVSENSYFRDFMSLMKIVGDITENAQTAQSKKAYAATSQQHDSPIPMNSQRSVVTSLSMDEPVQTVPAAHKSITKEEWANTLFGERGVLTGVFRMMDQQRKVQQAGAQSDHANDPSSKINGNLDFKTIFDSLLMGGSKGELGDPGPELPEQFLGICNRLSCGDIYKAVDKFRRSEFFSNFQTALTLLQDPNGWETIGKLLSNPELIEQFTAGSGMEEVFGSALGQAKKESAITKDKNSKLLPEDGDFGTDFTSLIDPPKIDKPEIDFNIDKPLAGDYYEQVSQVGSTIDYEDLDFDIVDQLPPSTVITASKPDELAKKEPEMPELSFSIDGNADKVVEGEVFQKPIDELPPSTAIQGSKTVHKAVGSSSGHVVTETFTPPTTTTRRVVTNTPTTHWTTRRTTTRSTTTTPRTTTKNFRKESDYYSMYYDDESL